jgi:hypothetical protein
VVEVQAPEPLLQRDGPLEQLAVETLAADELIVGL